MEILNACIIIQSNYWYICTCKMYKIVCFVLFMYYLYSLFIFWQKNEYIHRLIWTHTCLYIFGLRIISIYDYYNNNVKLICQIWAMFFIFHCVKFSGVFYCMFVCVPLFYMSKNSSVSSFFFFFFFTRWLNFFYIIHVIFWSYFVCVHRK